MPETHSTLEIFDTPSYFLMAAYRNFMGPSTWYSLILSAIVMLKKDVRPRLYLRQRTGFMQYLHICAQSNGLIVQLIRGFMHVKYRTTSSCSDAYLPVNRISQILEIISDTFILKLFLYIIKLIFLEWNNRYIHESLFTVVNLWIHVALPSNTRCLITNTLFLCSPARHKVVLWCSGS